MLNVAGTTPYAWPFDGELAPDRAALVVAGGGDWSRFVPADPEVDARIAELRDRLAAVGVLVVVVEHDVVITRLRPAEPPAIRLTAGPSECAVTAVGIDGFYGSPLDALLHSRRRSQLIVCGHGLETAVHSTVRRANDRGYECLTVVDASAAHDPSLRHASRSSIEMSGGIFGAAGDTADVIAAYTT